MVSGMQNLLYWVEYTVLAVTPHEFAAWLADVLAAFPGEINVRDAPF